MHTLESHASPRRARPFLPLHGRLNASHASERLPFACLYVLLCLRGTLSLRANDQAQQPGPLAGLKLWNFRTAAPVCCSAWYDHPFAKFHSLGIIQALLFIYDCKRCCDEEIHTSDDSASSPTPR
jgi:hypothetical protein